MKTSIRDQSLNNYGRQLRERLILLITVLALGLFFAGCGKSGGTASDKSDPEMAARLTQLTKELHHSMAGRKINRDFDEFVALNKLEVPPPPPGKKYAINEKWKVILVNK